MQPTKSNLRLLLHAAMLLLLGAVSSIGAAWTLSWMVDPSVGTATSGLSYEGHRSRSAQIRRFWFSQLVDLTSSDPNPWHAMQATGAPDTPAMGDRQTAWASATQDDRDEWLELTYSPPVLPVKILVYESNAPGALSQITAIGSAGQTKELWSGDDPATLNSSGIAVAEISVATSEPVERLLLELQSRRVSGWNEIDAVGLVDAADVTHWASSASASTNYGEPRAPSITFQMLQTMLPNWCSADLWPAKSGSAHYMAYGFPFIAMWGPERARGAAVPLAPLHPYWPGLLIDSILHGLTIWIVWVLTFGLRQFVRESRWLRRGCCMHCGYDLRWDLARGCPECGWRRQT